MELKRPYQFDDDNFARDILQDPLKRTKLQDLAQIGQNRTPEISTANEAQVPRFHNRQLHNIPNDSLPIIPPGYDVNDFFTDMDPQIQNKYASSVNAITSMFPPPAAPSIHDRNYGNDGIMIPFIYPPPPVIKPDPLIDDNEFFINRYKAKHQKDNQDLEDTENDDSPKYLPVTLAPLPFPPPNFMPYPLDANQASLLPQYVVEDLLDASDALPRVDMVVASAAGSIADLRYQAANEGFSIQDYYKDLREKAQSKQLDKAAEEEVASYYNNINTSNQFDSRYRGIYDPFDPPTKKLYNTKVQGILSDVKHDRPDTNTYSSDVNYQERVKARLSNNYDNLNVPDKKRVNIYQSLQRSEMTDEQLKPQALQTRKLEVLEKLKNLQKSIILLSDNENKLIKDDELLKKKNESSVERDLDLVRLKIESNYQTLRQLSSFYEDCNKAYKRYHGNTLKRLLKLLNFFEYQKTQFEKILKSDKSFNEFTDLNNKDSSKLFTDSSQRNYGSELKDILKRKILVSEDKNVQEAVEIDELIDKLNFNTFSKDSDEFQDISDFMPLITEKEFDVITTNLSKHKADLKLNVNTKHEIFKSSLYDSGSESASLSSSTPNPSTIDAPKRRGRRSNLEVDEENLGSETFLLAKIMKHFNGPQSVNNEQMDDDFKKLGITSKWK